MTRERIKIGDGFARMIRSYPDVALHADTWHQFALFKIGILRKVFLRTEIWTPDAVTLTVNKVIRIVDVQGEGAVRALSSLGVIELDLVSGFNLQYAAEFELGIKSKHDDRLSVVTILDNIQDPYLFDQEFAKVDWTR